MFGVNRRAVARGLQELELGKPIRIRPENRGRPRIEQQRPDIVSHTDALLSENSQVDPKFQTTLALTRVTGNELHGALATIALLRSKTAASRQVAAAGETKFASSCFATHGHPLRLAYSLQFCGFAGTFILSRCLTLRSQRFRWRSFFRICSRLNRSGRIIRLRARAPFH